MTLPSAASACPSCQEHRKNVPFAPVRPRQSREWIHFPRSFGSAQCHIRPSFHHNPCLSEVSRRHQADFSFHRPLNRIIIHACANSATVCIYTPSAAIYRVLLSIYRNHNTLASESVGCIHLSVSGVIDCCRIDGNLICTLSKAP